MTTFNNDSKKLLIRGVTLTIVVRNWTEQRTILLVLEKVIKTLKIYFSGKKSFLKN